MAWTHVPVNHKSIDHSDLILELWLYRGAFVRVYPFRERVCVAVLTILIFSPIPILTYVFPDSYFITRLRYLYGETAFEMKVSLTFIPLAACLAFSIMGLFKRMGVLNGNGNTSGDEES